MRTFVNLLVSRSFNILLEKLSEPNYGDDTSKRYLICPGDKFVKTTNMLDKAFSWTIETIFGRKYSQADE